MSYSYGRSVAMKIVAKEHVRQPMPRYNCQSHDGDRGQTKTQRWLSNARDDLRRNIDDKTRYDRKFAVGRGGLR